jgi:cytochrome b pre-mRNA-processing protein 3
MFNVIFVAVVCALAVSVLRWARTRTETGRRARRAYEAIVTQSRDPVFYDEMGVPDTIDGRFGVLVLHLFAAVERLSRAGEQGGKIARATVEAFITDVEDSMREVGIGDTSVPRRVKRAAIAYYDRRAFYRAGLLAGDRAALAATLATDIAGDASARCGLPLAHYLAASMAHLDALDDSAVTAGTLTFPGLSAAGAIPQPRTGAEPARAALQDTSRKA